MSPKKPSSSPRYGFVGVGTMSSAIVRGLCTLPVPPSSIVLSPRGAEKAAALAAQFPSVVTIAGSNQEVLERSDVVFIGVLPKQAEDVLRALNFEPRHTVVSLISTAPLSLLQEVCAPVPAAEVVRAIPLPPVATQHGACVMTPPHPAITAIFDSLGTVVPVATEEQMKRMMPVTGLMGQFYAQQRATQQWLEANGVEAESAAKWTGAVFHCISYDSADATAHTFEHLVAEQTPGGINEQVVRELTEAGNFAALKDSLDGILARVQGRKAVALKKTPYASTPETALAPAAKRRRAAATLAAFALAVAFTVLRRA